MSRLGIKVAQGQLLAPARRRVPNPSAIARTVAEITELATISTNPAVTAGPRLADLLHPAATLPETATSEQVRTLFADAPGSNGVVLVDEAGRPRGSLDRSRFLLAVTGPYGHALHARRPAARHADPPRAIHEDATSLQLLEMVGDTGMERAGDDVVVVDADRRCVGIVRLTEVIRAVAEAKIEQAVALNPLTSSPRRLGDAASRTPCVEWFARKLAHATARHRHDGQGDHPAHRAGRDVRGRLAGHRLVQVGQRRGRVRGRRRPDPRGRARAGRRGGDDARHRVSHVGGDDFLMVTDLDEIAPLAGRLVDRAWEAEGVLVTVSLASLACAVRSVRDYRAASRLLAPLKQQAKAVAGSSWVLGRPESDRVHVLRGRSGNRIMATG